MITYRTIDGKTVQRVAYMERQRLILEALTEKPWQTRAELGKLLGSEHTLQRMVKKGRLVRRERVAKWNPYEYAIPNELGPP